MKTEVYCSFCSLPHRVYRKNHISAPEILAFAFVSIVLTYGIWEDFHWTGCLLFTILAATTEMIYRARWRQSIKCKNCGFDPLVYKQEPEQAAQLVKDFMAKRRDDPTYLLRPVPKIKPIIKKTDKPIKSLARPREL